MGGNVEPLSEPVLLILLSLADQPRHGYAILKDVEAMSSGRVLLSTGTLYGALRRLLEDRWIERVRQDDTARGKVAYRLSTLGHSRVQDEVDRMKHITRLARLRVAAKEA
jgi:DNA-binding PadR family transcriptional regulator